MLPFPKGNEMKKILFIFLAVLTIFSWSQNSHAVGQVTYISLISAGTADYTASDDLPMWCRNKVFSAYGTTTAGAGTGTVTISASTNKSVWYELNKMSLTFDAGSDVFDGSSTEYMFPDDDPWPYIRATLESITGTGAVVDVHLSCQQGSF